MKHVVPLRAGQVIDGGNFAIACFSVRRPDTDGFGFSLESRARRRPRPDRPLAIGVPDGPVRKQLAEGRPEYGDGPGLWVGV